MCCALEEGKDDSFLVLNAGIIWFDADNPNQLEVKFNRYRTWETFDMVPYYPFKSIYLEQ
jgi:hypothetical protein